MNKENSALLHKYRTVKRKKIKDQLSEIDKANMEYFKLWVYDKALDVDFLKKEARKILIQKEELEKQYNAAATEVVDEMAARTYLRSVGVSF